jgi:ketosteroid isomerase-like protein
MGGSLRDSPAATLVSLLALLAGGCGLFSTEERRIVRRLEALADAASVTGEERPVVRLAGAARVGRYFTEDATVDAGEGRGPLLGRDAVAAVAGQARMAIDDLQVRVEDVEVALDTPDTATAHLTLVVSGRRVAGAARDPAAAGLLDAREVLVTLRRVGDDWLVASVAPLRTLERPR